LLRSEAASNQDRRWRAPATRLVVCDFRDRLTPSRPHSRASRLTRFGATVSPTASTRHGHEAGSTVPAVEDLLGVLPSTRCCAVVARTVRSGRAL
jgi:hypothetical protein